MMRRFSNLDGWLRKLRATKNPLPLFHWRPFRYKTTMKHIVTITTLVVASVLVTTLLFAADFTLRSKALEPGAAIGAEHYWNNAGCTGGNVMPDLEWRNAPKDTKSFAVTLFDQDAPTGSGFWHWVAYDIPAETTGLPGGANGGTLPAGTVEGNTDLGKPGFFGPCPPAGRQHTYEYTVHALKVAKLPVDKGVSPATVGFFLWQNGLAKATLAVKADPRK